MQPQSITLAPDLPGLDAELRAAILAQLAGPQRAPLSGAGLAAVAYERVSTGLQVSIPDQKRAIEEDAQRNGIPVQRHRHDVGSRWNDDRSGYQCLQEDIESGEYTHLWLHNADRLGGDDQEFVRMIRFAIRRNMVVRDTVHGEISEDMAMVLGLQSYWEIKNDHYRVVLKLEGKHLEGVKIGSVPVGYEPRCRLHPCRCGLHGKHVPHEVMAPLVQELFRRYDQGEGIGALQRWWNGATGEHRSVDRVRGILRDPYYVGIIVNCKRRNGKVKGRGKRDPGEWKVGKHDHPIIELEQFARVQARLRSQENVGQHRQTQVTHPLVGLVHCLHCNRRMRTKWAKDKHRSWDWVCNLCWRGRSVRKVEQGVHAILGKLPFPQDDALRSYEQDQQRLQAAARAEIKAIDAECDKINRRLSVWGDDRGDGTMSKEQYRAKVSEAEQRLAELRQQRDVLQDRHIAQPGRIALLGEVQEALQTMGKWTTTLDDMDPDLRRRVYRALIKAVQVDLDAGLLTVEYTEALADWCGEKSASVVLSPPKSR